MSAWWDYFEDQIVVSVECSVREAIVFPLLLHFHLDRLKQSEYATCRCALFEDKEKKNIFRIIQIDVDGA